MRFVIQHIDALLMMLFGVIMAASAIARGESRGRSLLRTGGFVLIVVGGLLLVLSQPQEAQWRELRSDDGHASVEFPGAAEKRMVGAATTYRLAPSDRQIAFFMSIAPLPPEANGLPDERLVDNVVQDWTQRGYAVGDKSEAVCGATHCWQFHVRQSSKDVGVLVRVAFLKNNIYRAVASFAGQNVPEEATRFVSSFRVQ